MDQAVQDVGTGARELIREARRLGLVWGLRPATVATPTTVVYDGDGENSTTRVVNMLDDTPEVGDRVMCMFVPPAGNFIVGRVIPKNYGRGLVAFAERTDASTAAAAATGVLRLSGVPLKIGRLYDIRTSNILLFNSTVNGQSSARLAYTIDGTDAGTGSTLLAIFNSGAIPVVASGVGAQLSQVYEATGDVQLSVVLFTLTLTGGNTSIFANASQHTQLMVVDMGAASELVGTAASL